MDLIKLPSGPLDYMVKRFIDTKSLYNLKYTCRLWYQYIEERYVNRKAGTKEVLVGAQYVNVPFIKNMDWKLSIGKNLYFLGQSCDRHFIRTMLKIRGPPFDCTDTAYKVAEGICKRGDLETFKWFEENYKEMISNREVLILNTTMDYLAHKSGNEEMCEYISQRLMGEKSTTSFRVMSVMLSDNFGFYKKLFESGKWNIHDLLAFVKQALKYDKKAVFYHIMENISKEELSTTNINKVLKYAVEYERTYAVLEMTNYASEDDIQTWFVLIAEEQKKYHIVRFLEDL